MLSNQLERFKPRIEAVRGEDSGSRCCEADRVSGKALLENCQQYEQATYFDPVQEKCHEDGSALIARPEWKALEVKQLVRDVRSNNAAWDHQKS